METSNIQITATINDIRKTLSVRQDESLLAVLRRASCFRVKSGCDDGTCGVYIVLLNGKPILSCKTKAADVEGAEITTLERLSRNDKLNPIQEAFMETGAIQCGFCTPAQILSAKVLLDRNSNPTEDEIRRSLNGVLCRCTGYVRGVDAVQRAAAVLRGEKVEPFTHLECPLPDDVEQIELPEAFYRRDRSRNPLPPLVFTPKEMAKTRIVGKPEVKVDAKKLAQALGFTLEEEMLFDQDRQPLNPNLRKYHIPRAAKMPAMDVIFV